MSNLDELCKILGEFLLRAEQDKRSHMQMIEMMMAAIAKILNVTLLNFTYADKSFTREKMAELMSELCAAMLRDFLLITNKEER